MSAAELQSGDIVFKNVSIVDGSGTVPRFQSNVVVRGDSILCISESALLAASTPGVRIIDGQSGKLALSPGFIDMHAHSDLSLLHTPDHAAKLTQGVTLEVVGQDGIGYAPVDDGCLHHIRRQIAGWNGNPEEESFWRWRSVREYLDTLDSSRVATNVAYLVPQGNLRMLVLGYDPRAATQDEIDKMKAILETAMNDGAVGMSSGLTYVPGMYASTSELGQLLTVVARRGGYYCPHTRSYGKGAMDAFREMIGLARETGVRLHLTHATLNFAENRGRAAEFLQMIDSAIADGIDITLDTYPYLPGSTTLAALLPSWAGAGGIDATLERLKDPETVAKIRHDVEVVGTDGCHGCTLEWSTIEICGVSNDPSLVSTCIGKTVADIAASHNPPWDTFDVFVDILLRDRLATTILQHVGHEENVRAIMRHPQHTGGSDGILTAVKPHPRGWGTFARYLGHYTRELPNGRARDLYALDPDALSSYATVQPVTIFEGGLEEAVAHLTSRSARVIGLKDRGLVRESYKADLVLFDPETVEDPAKGIVTVMVNGVLALDEGKLTGQRSGQTLRA
ncbi:N-acyl-D-amino acid deacylase family protein [Auriculariales sp. MPI-PUGE-AT-0066]|nr:N-acyl-D-amino acid deacylase family protein [Auriculariales sp. MPI-PUGE-AT-0066]